MLLWWSCQSPVVHSCVLLNHPSSFYGGTLRLHTKFNADSLLYLLSHFEFDSHTVHMLTQVASTTLLTSTVKSSLLMYVHSIPLSLAARVHGCCTNHSHCVNNGWTFSRQTWYIYFSSVQWKHFTNLSQVFFFHVLKHIYQHCSIFIYWWVRKDWNKNELWDTFFFFLSKLPFSA